MRAQIETFEQSIARADEEAAELQKEIDPARAAAEAKADDLAEARGEWGGVERELGSSVSDVRGDRDEVAGEVSALEHGLADSQAALGRALYEADSAGNDFRAELDRVRTLCDGISAAGDEIAAKELEIANLKRPVRRFLLVAGGIVVGVVVIVLLCVLPGSVEEDAKADAPTAVEPGTPAAAAVGGATPDTAAKDAPATGAPEAPGKEAWFGEDAPKKEPPAVPTEAAPKPAERPIFEGD